MRRDVKGLNHLSDGAGLNQFARVDRGLHLQPLGIHDGEHAAGFFNRAPHFGQPLERQ